MPSQYDDIQTGKLCLVPEALPDLPFYPVSLYRKLQIFLRKNQTDPGMTEVIRCCQDQKIPVRNFQLHVVEDFAVISRSKETM